MVPPTREEVKTLISDKTALEHEIEALFQILHSNKTNMTEALVDSEGYPRTDLDIVAVRQARHDIICKRNDLKALMEQIEHQLHELHAAERISGQNEDIEMYMDSGDSLPHRTTNEPFAVCDQVGPASPAAQSGLQVGDKFVQFGSLSKTNFRNLKQIGEILQDSYELFIFNRETNLYPKHLFLLKDSTVTSTHITAAFDRKRWQIKVDGV